MVEVKKGGLELSTLQRNVHAFAIATYVVIVVNYDRKLIITFTLFLPVIYRFSYKASVCSDQTGKAYK
jgi:hypothetical protein